MDDDWTIYHVPPPPPLLRFPFVFDPQQQEQQQQQQQQQHGQQGDNRSTVASSSSLSSSSVIMAEEQPLVCVDTRVVRQQERIEDEEVMFFPELEEDCVHGNFVTAPSEATQLRTKATVAGTGIASMYLHEEKTNNLLYQQQQQEEETEEIWDHTMDTMTNFASLSPSSQPRQVKADPTTTDKRKRKYKKRRMIGSNIDDGLPKRPLSAYNIFFKAKRAELLSHPVAGKPARTATSDMDTTIAVTSNTHTNTPASNVPQQKRQHVPPQMLGKVIGKQWRALKRSDRKIYQDMADRECERYRREMEAVQYNHEDANNNSKRLKKQSQQKEDHHNQQCSKESTTTAAATFVTPSNSPAHIPKLVHRAAGLASITATAPVIPTSNDTRWNGTLSSLGTISATTIPSSPAPQIMPLSMSFYSTYHHDYCASNPIATTSSGNSQQQYHFGHYYHHPPFPAAPMPYPALAVMAMPQGMEIYLTTHSSYTNNHDYGTSPSDQGPEQLRRTPSGEMDISNHHHWKQQPTISECSQQQQQRYRLSYQFYSMKRFQADQCLETFLTKGMQVIEKQQQK
jgi:hypothetical protein